MPYLVERSAGNPVLRDRYPVGTDCLGDLQGPFQVYPLFYTGGLVVGSMKAAIGNGQVIRKNSPRIQSSDKEKGFFDSRKLPLPLISPTSTSRPRYGGTCITTSLVKQRFSQSGL